MNITLTRKQRIKIRCSDDAFKVMKEILMREDKIDRDKEHFWVMGLAQNYRIYGINEKGDRKDKIRLTQNHLMVICFTYLYDNNY
ncbi:MAG: hypothetical protein HOO91_14680 [Bacteroidales bacterium]|nr:hypothetical protein [Bacteroidales bacterium]